MTAVIIPFPTRTLDHAPDPVRVEDPADGVRWVSVVCGVCGDRLDVDADGQLIPLDRLGDWQHSGWSA